MAIVRLRSSLQGVSLVVRQHRKLAMFATSKSRYNDIVLYLM